MEIIISIFLMVMFFKFLGFIIRAGFKVLGFLLSLAATLIVFALPIIMIGVAWKLLPIFFIFGMIGMLVRPRIV